MTLRTIFILLSLLLVALPGSTAPKKSKTDYTVDVCVYGGTSAGVMAAYKTAMSGKTVLLIEPGRHLGGLSSGGLGATDIGDEKAIGGLARDYYLRLGKKYGLSDFAWHFEPKIAEEVFNDYIREAKVDVLFDYNVMHVSKKKSAIKEIRLHNYEHGKPDVTIAAKIFVDCSYEGDLMALAGVNYMIGRESNNQYGEIWNGVQISRDNQVPKGIDPYVIRGDNTSGLIWGVSPEPAKEKGSSDKKIQAYCYRLCIEVLRRIIQQRDSMRWVQRIGQLYLRIIEMPNKKVDINNKGGFSLSMAGANWEYPEANYWRRKEIAKKIEDYNKGIIYFLGNDPDVPEHIRKQMLQYGWPKDEFIDNKHFSHQLYIREARRMTGQLVMTEHHCMSREFVEDGIARGSYNMDSHNCDRHVLNGMVVNEGDVQTKVPKPYDISYRTILPKRSECSNLLVPVCLSASHIAYGSVRMEPVFIMLGEAAGLAASLALDRGLSVSDLDGRELKQMLGL